MSISKHVLGVGVAGLLALSAAMPASAAPVLSNTAAVKQAAEAQTTEVCWRNNGGAVAAGVGVGLLAGAAIASSQQRSYYADPYYAPAPQYYGSQQYYGSPTVEYYEPAPSYGYYGGGNPYRSSRYYNGRADTNSVGNY